MLNCSVIFEVRRSVREEDSLVRHTVVDVLRVESVPRMGKTNRLHPERIAIGSSPTEVQRWLDGGRGEVYDANSGKSDALRDDARKGLRRLGRPLVAVDVRCARLGVA